MSGKEEFKLKEYWEDIVSKYPSSRKAALDIGVHHQTVLDYVHRFGLSFQNNLCEKDKPVTDDIGDYIQELLDLPVKMDLDFVSFDIETTNLTADFSVLLCACIKPYGKDIITFRSDDYPAWKINRANDSEIVQDIRHELSKHAVVITHYGTGFDCPYLRAKLAHYGMPNLPPMFGIDSYRIAKNNFKVSSRRLERLGKYFGCGEKSGVDGDIWLAAAYAAKEKCSEAMDKIVEHCKIDVLVLEKLAMLSFPYLKSIRKL